MKCFIYDDMMIIYDKIYAVVKVFDSVIKSISRFAENLTQYVKIC